MVVPVAYELLYRIAQCGGKKYLLRQGRQKGMQGSYSYPGNSRRPLISAIALVKVCFKTFSCLGGDAFKDFLSKACGKGQAV